MNCVRLNRGSARDLESFQKRALNWVCYESNWCYLHQLRLLNVLPLPLFMQCNDILLMSKLPVEGEHNINIPTCNPESGRSTMFFKLNKCKKEKTRGAFVYRTCRIINRINEKIQFANLLGLKLRIVSLMWKFVDNRFSDSKPVLWLSQHLDIVLIRSYGRNPSGFKPQEATTTTKTNKVPTPLIHIFGIIIYQMRNR